jgi:putative long chain acyl-CoA synthase
VLNELPQVDLAVAYGVGADDRELAVAAITVRKGATVDAELVTQALRGLIPAQRPGLVHVVADIYVGSSFRPSAASLKALGVPEPGSQVWYYDPADGAYRELTETAAKELLTGSIVG